MTVFTIGPMTTTSRSGGAGSPPVCNVSTSVTSALTSNIVVPSPRDTRSTLQRGDKVHALPYTRTIVETVPITGRYSTHVSFWDNTPSNPTFKFCKGKADVEREHSGDIGYLVSLTNLTAPPSISPSDRATLTGIANTKANADLRKALTNVPMLVAERRETLVALAAKVNQVRSLTHAAQQRGLKLYFATKFKDRRRVSKDIANEHLGLLFGLLPLIDDVQGAMELLSRAEPIVVTGRGRMAKEVKVNQDMSWRPKVIGYISSGYTYAYEASRESVTRFSVRTSISCSVDIPAAKLVSELGFNPLATFYDLVPLSFLTDFVSNFGSWLRAHDPVIGLQFRTGSTTTWEEQKENVMFQGMPATATSGNLTATLKTSGKSTGFCRALRLTRVPLTRYPDNALHWVNSMTWGKFLIGISLSVQRYVKPLRAIIALKPFRYRGPRPKYLPPIKYR